MAQVSSFDAPLKVASHDLIDSTIGIDPTRLEFSNKDLMNEPQFDLFTQLNIINNFTNNWEMDNKFQQFNTFTNVENISQNKIGNHLPKSSHTMRLWQRRMNSQKGEEKEFEALQDPRSEIDNSIQKRDYFTSYTPIDPSYTLAASDFQMKNVGHHNTSSSPAEFQHKQSSYGDNISSSSNKSCSPSSMFNGGLKSMQHESQVQNVQEGVSRESGTTHIDQFIKNMLSQTQSQDASTMVPLQSFVNFTSPSHEQQGPSPDLSIDAKNRWMDALLRESKNIELQKSSETSSKSPSSLQTRGEGVIGKMIVPFMSDETIDGMNLQKVEGTQIRHVCPHAGCEKHFSTSGHARRHSRSHNRFLRPFRCPHKGCHSTFTRRDNCTQHQKARHKVLLVAHRIKDDEL